MCNQIATLSEHQDLKLEMGQTSLEIIEYL